MMSSMSFAGLPSPHVWHALCTKTPTEKKLKRIKAGDYYGGDDDASHDYDDDDIIDDMDDMKTAMMMTVLTVFLKTKSGLNSWGFNQFKAGLK